MYSLLRVRRFRNRSRVETQMSSVQLGDRNLKNSEFLLCFRNLILNKLLNVT
jgi:hypothetical protein